MSLVQQQNQMKTSLRVIKHDFVRLDNLIAVQPLIQFYWC